MQPDVPGLADEIQSALADVGTPERAENEKRYLKSDLKHYGVTVPSLRRCAREFLARHPEIDHASLFRLIDLMWKSGFFEPRMVAIELLDMRSDLLGPGDMPMLEGLLRNSGTWALVDSLAATVVGGLVKRHPELSLTLDRWAVDEDFWLRRAALLALLVELRRGGGDWERFTKYADAMLEEREFFIRKAIGWVLRDTSKSRPDMVYEWLAPRAHRASGVTVREAVRYLAPAHREEILASQRSGKRSR